jgi:hypothetical protein
LTFISFTASPNGNDVLLKWTTEAEINTSHFDVEFSTDGSTFSKIGKVASLNTAGEHHYSCLHRSPAGTTLYYRILQVDLDAEVQKAATRLERERKDQRKQLEKAGTLLPTSETVPGLGPQPDFDFGDVIPGGQRPVRTAAKPADEAVGEDGEERAKGIPGEVVRPLELPGSGTAPSALPGLGAAAAPGSGIAEAAG